MLVTEFKISGLALLRVTAKKFHKYRMFWLYIGFISICAGYLTYVVYQNRFGQQTEQVLFKSILVPLVAAVGLVYTELHKPLTSAKRTIPVLIVRGNNFQIAELGNWVTYNKRKPILSGYTYIEQAAYFYHQQTAEGKINETEQTKEKQNLVSDLLEFSIVNTLCQNYPTHWQVEKQMFWGISSGGGGIQQKMNANPVIAYINDKELSRIFMDNAVFKRAPHLWINGFALPANSQFFKKTNEFGFRVLVVDTPELSLTIETRLAGGGKSGPTELGNIINARFPGCNDWSQGFWVVVKWEEKMGSRWSKTTEDQKKWAEEVSELLEQSFSWDMLAEEILLKGKK